MRHVFLPSPVTAGARRMGETAPAACLVAPARSTLGLAPGLMGAVSSAVDLPPVAVAADEHLDVAAGAEEKPGRRLSGPSAAAGRTWTKAAMGGILPPHSCPARCGARRRYPAWQLRVSAAPAFQSWQRLSRSPSAVSAPRRRASPANQPAFACSPVKRWLLAMLRMPAVPLARV